MSTMLEDLSEVVRIIPEDQHKHIPAAEWSDLWEYHKAVSGEGDLAYTWQDKPHRLVYNLTRIIAHMRITYRDAIAQNAEEIAKMRSLCAAVYQAAGAYDMPERFLDALSDAANGQIQARRRTDDLLPCDAPQNAEDSKRLQFWKDSSDDVHNAWQADKDRLKALVAMRDRWADDEQRHLNTFGQHLPASLACLIEQFDEIMRGGE